MMSWNVEGVATALVTANHDPEGLARVRVRYPWHDAPDEAYWARLCAAMAGRDRGALFVPDIGDEVLVGFERGDLRRPYVLGGLWSASAPPPQHPGADACRIIKSQKGHVLAFDDGSPASVELAAGDGRKVVFDEQGITLKDAKGNRLRIDGSGSIEIVTSGRLTIRASSVCIESLGAMEMKAIATLALRGALININ